MADRALCIALVGAECTGKTSLAQALAERLAAETGRRVAMVPEWLRAWCDAAGRTPRADEQREIAQMQQARIDAAARRHDIVVCDTTALMTAVYSQQVFGDDSLLAWALAQHGERIDLTLLTAVDLPWQADGLQRDGPQVQEPVDDRLRAALALGRLPFAVVAGRGDVRGERAWAAIEPTVRARGWLGDREASTPPQDVSTTTPASDASRWAGRRWRCDCCDPDIRAAERADVAARRVVAR